MVLWNEGIKGKETGKREREWRGSDGAAFFSNELHVRKALRCCRMSLTMNSRHPSSCLFNQQLNTEALALEHIRYFVSLSFN